MISLSYTILFLFILLLTLANVIRTKVIALVCILFISLSAIFIFFGFDTFSEITAVIGFLFLTSGVFAETVIFFEKKSLSWNVLDIPSIKSIHIKKHHTQLFPLSVYAIYLVSFLLLCVLLYLIYILSAPYIPGLQSNVSVQPKQSHVLAAETQIPNTPTTTVTPDVKKTLSILIENGTTITGLASRSAEILKKKGYQQVTISNIASSDYKRWVLYYQSDKENAVSQLKDDLGINAIDVQKKTDMQTDITIIAGTQN